MVIVTASYVHVLHVLSLSLLLSDIKGLVTQGHSYRMFK